MEDRERRLTAQQRAMDSKAWGFLDLASPDPTEGKVRDMRNTEAGVVLFKGSDGSIKYGVTSTTAEAGHIKYDFRAPSQGDKVVALQHLHPIGGKDFTVGDFSEARRAKGNNPTLTAVYLVYQPEPGADFRVFVWEIDRDQVTEVRPP
jgi:hypothetical protein